MTRDFHRLVVSDTRDEIGGLAKSVMFEVPPALKSTFTWRAGQHLTLRFTLDGQEVRRSYSISSSPVSGDPLRITVKRVKNGLLSNHINDRVKPGDVIDVMPPFGRFCLDTGATERRTHYFFGAGSGITPLHAMIQSVMVAEPHSVAHLAYGNLNADSILLNDSFEALVQQHPDRLSVNHVLSAPSLWSGFSYWRKGIVDKAAIEALITENPPYAQDAQYYICGPGGMNTAVKAALMSLDVPATRIHMESYGGAVDLNDGVTGTAATATVTLAGTQHTVPIAAGQTVLDAVRASGLTPPFSCQSGVCGACRAQLSHGDVHMRARMALEDSDVKKGAILTCQSVASSANITLTYDV